MSEENIALAALIVCAGVVLLKFIVLGYIAIFRRYRLPKDDSGPVSGWGTPEG